MNNSQKGFAMPAIIAIVAVVLVLGGVMYYANQSGVKDNKIAEEKAMMEKKAMEEKAAMEKEAMMKKEEGAMMDKSIEETMKKDEMMMKKGSYEVYSPEKLALATSGDVVLFFRASWCPTCRALDADIRANLDKIPAGVAILDVNYDTATSLKQKYGVTYQHTLVQVDASGNQIAKWSSSPTLASLLTNIK